MRTLTTTCHDLSQIHVFYVMCPMSCVGVRARALSLSPSPRFRFAMLNSLTLPGAWSNTPVANEASFLPCAWSHTCV